MELWKFVINTLKEESVYALILAFVGASLIVLKEQGEQGKKPLVKLFTFLIGFFLSVTLVPFIADTLEIIALKRLNVSLVKLRPFEYFAMAYFGDRIFDGVQKFGQFLMSKETRSKLFKAILNWLLRQLTSLQDKEDDKQPN